jgi:Tol biopolymer transport system component
MLNASVAEPIPGRDGGASWGPDDSIVFSPRCDSDLSLVSADGGAPETLTTPDPKREESGHRLPHWLPGGKALLFTVTRHEWDLHPYTAVLQLNTREWRILLEDVTDARYVPTGHVVFLRQGTPMGVRFDPAKLTVIGQSFPLVENVAQWFEGNDDLNTGAGRFSVSDSGNLIYAMGRLEPDSKNSLVWVDQRETEEPATPLQLPFFAPRVSPDGRRIVDVSTPAGRDQQPWLYDLTTGANSRLTTEGSAMFPIWTPDGERIVLSWHKSLAANLFWQVFDGSAPMERLTTSTYRQFAGSWSADVATLVFVEQDAVSICRLAQLDLRSRQTTTSQVVPFRESFPEISPGGLWLAYVTPESTRSASTFALFRARG